MRLGLKLSRMNWAVFNYLAGHRFYPNHERFKIPHLFFSWNKISLFALRTIEFLRNIGNLQSMKRRMMVKWNWRKSRIIFPRENEQLVCVWIYFRCDFCSCSLNIFVVQQSTFTTNNAGNTTKSFIMAFFSWYTRSAFSLVYLIVAAWFQCLLCSSFFKLFIFFTDSFSYLLKKGFV